MASFTPKLALEGLQIQPQTSPEGGGRVRLLYVLVSSRTEVLEVLLELLELLCLFIRILQLPWAV